MVYQPPVYDIPVATSKTDVKTPNEPLPQGAAPFQTIYPVFAPAEEFFLPLLRDAFEHQGIRVVDQHTKDTPLPMILVRSSRQSGATGNLPDDPRFLRSLKLTVTAIMEGVDADSRCANLLEAVQHVIMNAWHNQTVIPGVGHIAHFDAFTEPSRVSDFQTATNIVQYASLPRGNARYEQVFNIFVRPDTSYSRNEFLAEANLS